MFSKVLFVCFVVSAFALPQYEHQQYQEPHGKSYGATQGFHGSHHGQHGSSYGGNGNQGYDKPAQYQFEYAVNDDYSGNNYGHKESRDGDRTEGSYYVLLPDGRLQKVEYYVDGYSGFVAHVSYEGEAKYDQGYEQNRYQNGQSHLGAQYQPSYQGPQY